MAWGRVTETELMPRLVGGYTELGGSKLKNCNGFLKPNFELGPKLRQVRQVRRVKFRFGVIGLYHISINFSGRVYER